MCNSKKIHGMGGQIMILITRRTTLVLNVCSHALFFNRKLKSIAIGIKNQSIKERFHKIFNIIVLQNV